MREAADHYDLTGGFHRLRVREHSPLVGSDPWALDLSAYAGITVTAVQSSDGSVSTTPLSCDDVLVVTGPSEVVDSVGSEATPVSALNTADVESVRA